jgi:hypothetical protein
MSVWESEGRGDDRIFRYIEGDVFSNWMRGKSIADVGDYLKTQKYEYKWIRETPPKVANKENDGEAAWLAQINGE